MFTSFDYDHDAFLRTALVGQSKHEDTPFEILRLVSEGTLHWRLEKEGEEGTHPRNASR